MGKSQRFPVGFPPAIRDVIKQQVGILGNSESEVVKNIVLIYFTEKGLLKTHTLSKNKKGGEHG
jgi:hypothetical protein